MTPDTRTKRILIVGGGIGGLTFGAALNREGIEPHIIERAEKWAPIGAGIVLGVNAMSLCRELDIAEAIESRGRIIRRGHITDASGRILSTMDLAGMTRDGQETVSIHRADLHEVLLSANGNVSLGTTLTSIDQGEDEARVVFSDGVEADYDLVVGADGIASQVRELVFGEQPRRYSGYTCWRFVVNGDFGITETAEMWGQGRRFGIVPIGGDAVYCYATLNAPRGAEEYADIYAERLKELFSEFGGDAPRILDALRDDTPLIQNDLEEVRLNQWVEGRVALIGDAAHAMTPNMGQGAAMAIEDAMVLCQSIEESPVLPVALRQYEERRRDRVATVQRRSWNFGRVGQLESSGGCAMRNALVRLLPKRIAQNSVKKLLWAEI